VSRSGALAVALVRIALASGSMAISPKRLHPGPRKRLVPGTAAIPPADNHNS